MYIKIKDFEGDLKIKKIRYPTENEKEGKTKLENLVRHYPFHFMKVYNEYKQDREFPISQIIISCKMKGFAIPSSDYYLRDMMQYGGLNTDDINQFENLTINHLNSLINEIGYTETKEYIEMNNAFKELNVWINEMFTRLSFFDNEGGWKKKGIDEIAYNEEQSRIHYKKMEEERKRSEEKRNKELIEIKSKGKIKFTPNRAILSSGGYRCESEISNEFRNIFGFRNFFPREQDYNNLMTSEEFDDIITDILQLCGKGSYKCNSGKIRLIGTSVEDVEESRIYSSLQKYPRVLKNMDDALEHKIKKKWNDVALYCCKAIEYFYKTVLGNKKEVEKLTIGPLVDKIRKKRSKLFRCDDTVLLGVDKLLLSCVNLVGTIRNSRDSAHGNDWDVEEWEGEMVYSYTILLLKTLLNILA